jgi:hypothetical protein
MTNAQWEMNAVRSMERVQDRKATEMVLEKNRRIAYKNGWRRLWDGRSGALFEKWAVKTRAAELAVTQAAMLQEEAQDDPGLDAGVDVDADSVASSSRPGRRGPRGGTDKAAAYDVVSTFVDPRTATFPCDADTVSEDEIDRLERENFEVSSEEEFVPSDEDA